jgi:hypothetical protein
MPSIIRRAINYGRGLLSDDTEWLTSAEASARAAVGAEQIRRWCQRYGIGKWDARLNRYRIDPAKLDAHLEWRRRRKVG